MSILFISIISICCLCHYNIKFFYFYKEKLYKAYLLYIVVCTITDKQFICHYRENDIFWCISNRNCFNYCIGCRVYYRNGIRVVITNVYSIDCRTIHQSLRVVSNVYGCNQYWVAAIIHVNNVNIVTTFISYVHHTVTGAIYYS